MGQMNILCICSLLLLIGVKFSSGQIVECGRFEQWVECVDPCNMCHEIECEPVCLPGYVSCDCIPGYTRNHLGKCIPRTECRAIQGRSSGLLGLDLNVDGCPNISRCMASCRRRRFTHGVCAGPDNFFCICFSPIRNPL
ncbi:uncharacterized protein TNCT_677671 [Trichonephila clavata]|uniref:TIL domain-containing protein n=1 Tax=Trichonephila clavata TaxID=2740835 RepID=A0A8X6GAM9_TRICU|nr:uncharacterized protein TNCT_677671 [Trichonephila clavata]